MMPNLWRDAALVLSDEELQDVKDTMCVSAPDHHFGLEHNTIFVRKKNLWGLKPRVELSALFAQALEPFLTLPVDETFLQNLKNFKTGLQNMETRLGQIVDKFTQNAGETPWSGWQLNPRHILSAWRSTCRLLAMR